MNFSPRNELCVCGRHVKRPDSTVFLSRDELSSRWKVSAGWIYKNHKRLGLPAIKLGGQKLRFPLDCLLAWESKEQSETASKRSANA